MRRRSLLLALPAALLALPAGAEEARQRGGGESFVQLPAVNVNVRSPGRRFGILTADIGLDIPDAALRTRAESLTPRLLADFSGLLQAYVASLRPGEPPDPDAVAQRLQASVDRTLGGRGARVLLGGVLVR